MSADQKTQEEREWRGLPEEEAVRRLLAEAGPRPPLPEEDLAAIRDAARAEWRRQRPELATGSARRRLWTPLAAAASLAAVLGGLWWMTRSQPGPVPAPPAALAAIELVTGGVRIIDPGSTEGREAGAGDRGRSLAGGTEIETAPAGAQAGRLALRTTTGASVRLDAGTRVRLAAADRIELLAGAVYVDTGAAGAARGLAVQAPAGLFQDVGTQFEVRVEGRGDGSLTRLRVREGRVELDHPTGRVAAGAGEALVVHAGRRAGAGVGAGLRAAMGLGARRRPDAGDRGREGAGLPRLAGPRDRPPDRIRRPGGGGAGRIRRPPRLDRAPHPAEAPGVVLASAGLAHRLADGELVVYVAPAPGS